MLIVIVLVLIVLAARVHAEPGHPGSPSDASGASDEIDDDPDEPDEPDEPDPPAPPPAHDDFDQLALLDAELTPGGAIAGDDASFAAAAAGAYEAYETWIRDRTTTRVGRFDVGLALRWHHNAPAHAAAYQTGELWLVATWRR